MFGVCFCKYFFFSSRRRHTRCALVTGVQTCALPISFARAGRGLNDTVLIAAEGQELPALLSQDNPVICAETGATDLAIFGEAGSPVERWLPLCDPPQHEAGDDEADQCTSGERFQHHGFVPIITERSEEHTSELQSLMRISYAVFCLKKQNNTILNIYTYITTSLT